MESTVEVVASVSEVNGKRCGMEDRDALEGSAPKRIKGLDHEIEGDVKKVAEIVLVLAAMGKMRGGKGPSDAEKELMEAARSRLANLCEGFAPKDVFPREAFGGVIEDLGLSKLKEQKLGLRPPKMSIADKLLVSIKKMERAAEFALTSSQPSRLPGSTAHGGRISGSDKPTHVSGGAANMSSLSYQLPTSEIRPVASGGTAVPRVDRPHIRSDGRQSVSSYPSQSHGVKNSTWPAQHHSGFSSNTGSDARVSHNMPMRNDNTAGFKSGLVPQTDSRAFAAQTIGGLQGQGANSAHLFSLRSTHAEIAKIVQKLLQPRDTDSPVWDPPSRDYMNKALTCQNCKSTATDIDSILICDACEKGYHYLKCLGMKEVPRVEWHCAKCLSLSNGQPLPPKFGRVMRNANSGKVASSDTVVPAATSASAGASMEKVNQPTNDDVALGDAASGFVGSDQSSASFVKADSCAEHVMFGNSSVSSRDHAGSIEKRQSHGNHVAVVDSKGSIFNESSNSGDHFKDEKFILSSPSGAVSVKQDESSGIGIPAVKWIGDPVHVFEEKYFYASCFVNGHPYKTTEHALVRFEDGKLLPAKIQAFWEDTNTAMKWVTANQCYFPDDLPESIGRPCGLENNEVCESTRGHVCRMGSIEGPCLVLPPRKFAEESERRAHSVEEELHDHLTPLYLCKWIYDEGRGLFRDASFL